MQLKLKAEEKKYIGNTAWLISEKLIRLLIGATSSFLVARYLGPENFGVLSYSISIVMLFAMLNHLGLDGLSVRYLVEKPNDESSILGTVFTLKMAASLVALIGVIGFALVSYPAGSLQLTMLLVCGLVILVKPFEIIAFFFQSKVRGRNASLPQSIAVISASSSRLLFVFLAVAPIWFGIAYLFEFILAAGLFCVFYGKFSATRMRSWSFDKSLAKEMLSMGWMVMLGAIFAILYKKVDQVMLMWMSGPSDVGVYATAAQLSDVWAFLPVAIASSIFPKLIQIRRNNPQAFNASMQALFDLLTAMALILALAVTIIAKPLISLLGEAYSASATVLIIHIWSIVFVFQRALFSKWIHIEKVFVFSTITQGLGACSNVILNYLLIPQYGPTGAAVATLVSYGFASYFGLALARQTRPVFWMMTKSFLLVFRIPQLIRNIKNLRGLTG